MSSSLPVVPVAALPQAAEEQEVSYQHHLCTLG